MKSYVRGTVLGLLLGFAISAVTFVNDEVLKLSGLADHALPVGVFVFLLCVALLANPLLARMRQSWQLSRPDLAMMTAIGLVACAWPGPGFFTYFTHLVAAPAIQAPTKPYWKSTQVFSYLPDGSPELTPGYVLDWPGLTDALTDPDGELASWSSRLPPVAQDALDRVASGQSDSPASDQRRVLAGINELLAQPRNGSSDSAIDDPHAAAVANRQWLETQLPGVIRTMPEGTGMLLGGGRRTQAVNALVDTTSERITADPRNVPWDQWWPVLRLWGGLLLMMAAASFGLMLLIYPQWAKHELLTFPIARFVEELTATEGGQSKLPAVCRMKGFWIAGGLIALLHLWNGLAAWFTSLPAIPLQLDFTALSALLPTTAQQYGFGHFFAPTLIPTVIAFAYFIDSRVSLSVGLSAVLWLVLGTILAGRGITLSTNRFDVGPIGPAIRFGAYLGMAAVIVYLARHHLRRVILRSFGLGRPEPSPGDCPASSVVGLWLMVIGSTASVVWLLIWTPVTWPVATVLVGMILVMWLVVARINAETGLFAVSPEWIPWVMLASLVGPAAIGMESLIVLAMGGLVLAAQPRVALAPLLINALHLGRSMGKVRTGRLAPWLALMTVASLVVALVVTLSIQYSMGLDRSSTHYRVMPGVSLGSFTRVLTEQNAVGNLADVTRPDFADQLSLLNPDTDVLAWCGVGAMAVCLCLLARLRLAWWPIHPVIFLIFGTYLGCFLAASFLVAWLIKSRVIALGGQKAYDTVKPAMVGLIVGELAMVAVWGVVGLIYRLQTGTPPEPYSVIPI